MLLGCLLSCPLIDVLFVVWGRFHLVVVKVFPELRVLRKLAQRKHFPAVNWNISFSKYIRRLTCIQIYSNEGHAFGVKSDVPCISGTMTLASPMADKPVSLFLGGR